MKSVNGTVRPQSNDTTLSDLALEDASNGDAIALDPGFAPDHFDYAASVRFTVSQVTVTSTKNDPNARIFPLQDGDNNELSDADTSQSGFQVDLVAGAQNVIKVVVQSEAGSEDPYTVTVTRAPEPGQVLLSEKLLSLTEGNGASYSVRLNRQPAANVTVTIGGHGGTNVTPNSTSLTFTTSNWRRLQWVFVSTSSDTNTRNESVTLTHEATSSDSLFDDFTIPSVIVNVDDQDAPDRHIHTIRVPAGSHALPPGEKPLPEEEFTVDTGEFFGEIEGVAEGHVWRPSGLWGDPGDDTIWVVDPSHFGIHALKLSALKEGRIERRVAADTSVFDQRLNYRCHFESERASGRGNPSLTVMWGTNTQLWVANDSSGTIDSYARNHLVTSGCYTRHVTSWTTDGQSYTVQRTRISDHHSDSIQGLTCPVARGRSGASGRAQGGCGSAGRPTA